MIRSRLILMLTLLLTLIPHDSEAADECLLTSEEAAWLERHRVLRVAGPKAFPPFQFTGEDGAPMGMAADYVELLSRRLGVRMEIQTGLAWPVVLKKARNRELDVLSCTAKTPDRKTYLAFSRPFLSFPMVIVSRKDAPFIGGLQDLHGKKIACMKKVSSYEWLVQDQITFEPHFVNSPLEALEAVSLGRADAHIGNLAAVSYLIQKNGLLNLKIAAPTPYGNYDLFFAVRRDWPELIPIINKGLASITPEEHNAIRQKWIAVRYEHGIDPAALWRIALQVSGGAAVIIILIFLWNRQIWRREERFRCLTEHGSDIIQAFREDGTIVYQSPSHKTVLGYDDQELMGRSAFDLFHRKERELWDRMLADIRESGEVRTFEHRLLHRSGHYLYFESHCVSLLQNNALKAIVITGREITQRRQAAEELRQAKEAAEVANHAKSTFLANMSHELRTPLNAILGFSQLMSRSRLLPQEHAENIAVIRRSGEHLLNLINDVLDMSKIEADRVALNEKNFDLYHLLDDLQDMFWLQAEKAGLELTVDRTADLPRYIRTDETRLRQVLINLLNNAIKFTLSGKVALRVSEEDEAGSAATPAADKKPLSCKRPVVICFEVEDTGPGISPDELEKLFDPFVQTKTGEQSQEGTGLGLPISRKFVQLMGGEIQVSSVVGSGSVFRFNIRACEVRAKDVRPRAQARRVIALQTGQPRYRILIVDDRWDNRQLLIRLLTPLGFETREAANGQEAIEVWEDWRPHLIWMDMRMPVMDGYEAVQRIKATIRGQATAVVALTASSLEEERAVVLSAGCDDFMRKPFREEDIFEMMHKHLGVRYVYEDETASDLPKASRNEVRKIMTPEALDALPEDLVRELERAVVRADMLHILHLVKEISTHDAALGDSLARLANDFEYSEISKWLQKARGHTGDSPS